MQLANPLTLPCGITVKNRFAKSAMSEALGNKEGVPTQALVKVYDRWSRGECGLLITGNVMIDPSALGEPNNVVLEDEKHLKMFERWAQSGRKYQTQIWVQLNHPGKQSPAFLSPEPVAPSDIPLEGALKAGFKKPRALSIKEIWKLVERFGRSAELCKKAGFDGVQIHGAHGYLVSQFLSPKHNQRTDEWGGSFEKRSKFVLEIYRAIRNAVGNEFPISIKLNSSDFQKGGFIEEESACLIRQLSNEGMDLIEISGGTYEKPTMMGIDSKTQSREAYFSHFAEKVRSEIKSPMMLTGGFRTTLAMEEALINHVCDLVGLARPLALDPDLPKKILSGDRNYKSSVHRLSTGFKTLDNLSMLNITWYEQQIAYLGEGKEPKADLNPYISILKTLSRLGTAAFQKRRA